MPHGELAEGLRTPTLALLEQGQQQAGTSRSHQVTSWSFLWEGTRSGGKPPMQLGQPLSLAHRFQSLGNLGELAVSELQFTTASWCRPKLLSLRYKNSLWLPEVVVLPQESEEQGAPSMVGRVLQLENQPDLPPCCLLMEVVVGHNLIPTWPQLCLSPATALAVYFEALQLASPLRASGA